ncbi:hypothetical protein SALBM311S_10024 [Streptomyces alboniger]
MIESCEEPAKDRPPAAASADQPCRQAGLLFSSRACRGAVGVTGHGAKESRLLPHTGREAQQPSGIPGHRDNRQELPFSTMPRHGMGSPPVRTLSDSWVQSSDKGCQLESPERGVNRSFVLVEGGCRRARLGCRDLGGRVSRCRERHRLNGIRIPHRGCPSRYADLVTRTLPESAAGGWADCRIPRRGWAAHRSDLFRSYSSWLCQQQAPLDRLTRTAQRIFRVPARQRAASTGRRRPIAGAQTCGLPQKAPAHRSRTALLPLTRPDPTACARPTATTTVDC